MFTRHAQINHRIPPAQGGRDDEARQQEQGTEDGHYAALIPGCRVDASPVRKMFADDDVVITYKSGEGANREDDGKGRESRRHEGKTNDISLAGTPIAVK